MTINPEADVVYLRAYKVCYAILKYLHGSYINKNLKQLIEQEVWKTSTVDPADMPAWLAEIQRVETRVEQLIYEQIEYQIDQQYKYARIQNLGLFEMVNIMNPVFHYFKSVVSKPLDK